MAKPNFSKEVKLGEGTLQDNGNAALAFTVWLRAQLEAESTLTANQKRRANLDRLMAFVLDILIDQSRQHKMLLQNVLGEDDAAFLKNFQKKGSFAHFIAHTFYRLLKSKDTLPKLDKSVLAPFLHDFKAQIKRLQAADLAAQSKQKKSIADYLRLNGFISLNESAFSNDVAIALKHYAGQHGNVHVDPSIDFGQPDDRVSYQADITRLKDRIRDLQKKAQATGQSQILLAPSNNGAGHFIFLKIVVNKVPGGVSIQLEDSLPENRISAAHKTANECVVGKARDAAKKALGGVVPLQEKIDYKGLQGSNANCPYYAVNRVVQECHTLGFNPVPGDKLASVNINEVKHEVIQLVIQHQKNKRPADFQQIDPRKLEIDELGIVHQNAQHPNYLQHRQARLAEIKTIPNDQIQVQRIVDTIRKRLHFFPQHTVNRKSVGALDKGKTIYTVEDAKNGYLKDDKVIIVSKREQIALDEALAKEIEKEEKACFTP